MEQKFGIAPGQEHAYLTFLERIDPKQVVPSLSDAEKTLARVVEASERRIDIREGLVATLDLYKAYPPKDPTFAGMRKHFPEAYGVIMTSLFEATQRYNVKL